MHLPVQSVGDWHAIRAKHIGGSEIAGLFSLWALPNGEMVTLHGYEPVPDGAKPLGAISPYHDAQELWLIKSGKHDAQFEETERMQAGSFLEPAIAAWSKDRWGWPIRKVRRYIQHPACRGWGASLDYELHETGSPPVEIKNVDYIVARDTWNIEGDTVLAAPVHYMLQLQHCIGATGADHGWLVAVVGGNTLVRGRFERHEPTIQKIWQAVSAFWAGVAQGERPPTGISKSSMAIEFRQGVKDKVEDLRGDNEIGALVQRRVELKDLIKPLTLECEHVEAAIQGKVGDATRAVFPGGRIAWPVIDRPETTIVQKAKVYRGALTITLDKAA